MRFWLTVGLVGVFGYPASAQDLELNRGAVGTYLRLKELQTIGRVLHVVAHPDDEDGALLAYCARGLGARTMLFSITRGEGGANLISSDFFDELGALRTLEHLKAASYYGNELFYSRAADYGYSKTLTEAMRQWQNGVPVLADLVEVIRRERPQVILSRFQGDPRDGHGHHQMAGFVSRLAFAAAADASQFPEQLANGLETWQANKLYVRAGSPWRPPNDNEWTIAIPTGSYDPVIGRTYAQIARFGLGFQRSQGMSGHEGDPGMTYSYYRLEQHAGMATPAEREASLFDGLPTALHAMVAQPESSLLQQIEQSLRNVQRRLADAYQGWDPREPEGTIAELTSILQDVRSLEIRPTVSHGPLPSSLPRDIVWLERKLVDAIATAAGVQVDAWATDLHGEAINHATSGRLQLHVRVANHRTPQPITVTSIDAHSFGDLIGRPATSPQEVAAGAVLEAMIEVDTSGMPATKPHWRRDSIASPLYTVEPAGGQKPMPQAPLGVIAAISLNGVPLELSTGVQTRQQHPEFGRVEYPLTVAPPIQVRFPLRSGLVTLGHATYDVSVTVQSSLAKAANVAVQLELPSGWRSTPASHELAFQREDEVATVNFQVSLPEALQAGTHEIRAVATFSGNRYDEGFETVSARQVGRMNVYRPALHRVQVADVQLAGTPYVGYISGSGDQVATSLGALGVTPTMLAESDLASADLTKFDVILVGVRAYAVREDVRKHNGRLLDYVKRGGVLIVQYQTPEFDQNFGPYPYTMGRNPEEVSEEDATVTILQRDHPLFSTPNRIGAADFEGWFEQRGSKFWQSWDPNYVPLLECHDAGQPPQQGGLLLARFGNGVYVYSAYAWYRQLPNGVPGAYRLFANMLSLPTSDLVRKSGS